MWLFSEIGESEMNISCITSTIDVILPDLPITTKQSLEDTLQSLGVETPEDTEAHSSQEIYFCSEGDKQVHAFVSVTKTLMVKQIK